MVAASAADLRGPNVSTKRKKAYPIEVVCVIDGVSSLSLVLSRTLSKKATLEQEGAYSKRGLHAAMLFASRAALNKARFWSGRIKLGRHFREVGGRRKTRFEGVHPQESENGRLGAQAL
jgi:hypothetical protein